MKEEEENVAWHAAATDANIIKKEFSILKERGPRANGDRTWNVLMRLVNKTNWKISTQSIEEEMLNIWSKTFLEYNGPPLFAQKSTMISHCHRTTWNILSTPSKLQF